MGSHVLRPLYVVVVLLAIALVARAMVVPADFGIGERGYMYGWHRQNNEAEWKAVKVKFRPRDYCKDCHSDKMALISKSPHTIINCQNCHGPARDHPLDPPKLDIDRRRELCLRCHSSLPYPTSGRTVIRGFDPAAHNPGMPCVSCHNPHSPVLGGAK